MNENYGTKVETPESDLIGDKKMIFQELQAKIIQWAIDRDIYTEGTSKGQVLKTQEEVGELVFAVGEDDLPEIIDAIGDIQVCLINLCEMVGVDMEGCLQSAYNEIKDRKGKMRNGKFVKESEDAKK